VSRSAAVSVANDGDLVVVTLTGEIDIANAGEVEDSILEAVPNAATGLIFDASGLAYLDSSGVRLLLSVAARLRWRGQGFVLVAPEGSRCRHVLSLAGIESAFPVEAAIDDASARLRADVESDRPRSSDDGPPR
jgi:anti-sigma B factor antagonist/stage II sporulation protein AA (anti-sigma F factor antagonist)